MLKKQLKNQFPRIQLRTRNYSADDLRDLLRKERFKKPVIVRLGSTTKTKDITLRNDVIELNTVNSILTSRSKILMHKAFDNSNVKSAKYWTQENFSINKIEVYPVLAKKIAGQGGNGMKKLDSKKELEDFIKKIGNLQQGQYYIEQYFSGKREYRLHVTENGCFLAWRKMRKQDAKDRWYFNSNNCVWMSENNPQFDKPVNWDEIIKESVKALKAVGLSIGAIDVRVQNSTDENGKKRKKCEFIILETNSAPSLGNVGTQFYHKEIVKLANKMQ